MSESTVGKITEIIGAVVDVEFESDHVPNIYDAIRVDDYDLTLEVQQQLGGGVVRTIAMGSTDGLKRSVAVRNTGAPIQVPVGQATLGRIMNVLGEPIDRKGPIATTERASIHLAVHQCNFIEYVRFHHFMIEIVTFTSTLTNTCKHRITTMFGRNIANQFHHVDGLTNTRASQ